jgi:hypothetical protein
MNIIKEKILTEEEKYYSYPIKVSNSFDADFLDQSKTTGMIFFGKREFSYPKFWRNEKFKLPFNEFYIREYEKVSFEVVSNHLAYFDEGDRIRFVSPDNDTIFSEYSELHFNKVFPALNFMGYLWQHFVQDVLPILYFGKEFLNENSDVVILLYEGIPEDIVNYFLGAFKINNQVQYIPYSGKIISADHLYKFETNVQIPTYWWNNFFYEGIHKIVNENKNHSRKNLIYTKRLYRRTVLNEDEFKEVLKEYAHQNNLNFIEFESEHYDIEERVNIFNDAHTIVSPHGGANYHILFAPKGCKFIEYTFADSMYTLYNIASSIELDYYVVPGGGNNTTISFEVDLNKLKWILNL